MNKPYLVICYSVLSISVLLGCSEVTPKSDNQNSANNDKVFSLYQSEIGIEKFQSWKDEYNNECNWLFNLKEGIQALQLNKDNLDEADCSQNILYEKVTDDEVIFSSTCTGDSFKLDICEEKYLILHDYYGESINCSNQMQTNQNTIYIDEKHEHLVGLEWQCKKKEDANMNIYDCAQEGYEFESDIKVYELFDRVLINWDGSEILLKSAC